MSNVTPFSDTNIIHEEKYNTLYGWHYSVYGVSFDLFEEDSYAFIEGYSVLTLISFGRPSASLSIAIWTF